ncbi:Txe/YoeB family addiction module toxin [Fructilactobacillus lindneri]|uniref:Endoribonuclease YoeB n=2 Tax=Fructilactobacillus lindneri TaxID=53444 RepID=A0A0R2JXG3_9LACO|nr:Txe/YoeB family addiction module toxin [Fructilactobacillus lindneri]KRN79258.1 hypothetical protein IV52_GL000667 [Fructilactobacillus lindneri DSM 20690 = JCM 11027]SJZ71254.1 toxin YoeB [Fructilactobacillus lindneri DSM 20690 = JCM 11027]
MNKEFTINGWKDYIWYEENSKKDLKRVNKLIKSISRTPYEGLGKPEPLHGDFSGYWSRRVNEKDRIVYKAINNKIIILACRTHYE